MTEGNIKDLIECACGKEFKSKIIFYIHIITLGCYDRYLVLKDAKQK